jgi:hypothetical protein
MARFIVALLIAVLLAAFPEPGRLAGLSQAGGDALAMGRDPSAVLNIILEGVESPVTANGNTTFSLPVFASMSDGEIADVATYYPKQLGCRAPAVSEGEAGKQRRAIAITPD